MSPEITGAVAGEVRAMVRGAHLDRRSRDVVKRAMPVIESDLTVDLAAHAHREPTVDLDPWLVLASEGFHAVMRYRLGHALWTCSAQASGHRRRDMRLQALALMEESRRTCRVEMHPGADLRAPFVLDHPGGNLIGQGVRTGPGAYVLHGTLIAGLPAGWARVSLGVVGETAVAEPGCFLGGAVVLGAAHIGTNRRMRRHPLLAANVQVADGVHILGRVRIGEGVRIGAGAIVMADVGAGSVIEAAAVVQGRVGCRAHVGAHALVTASTPVPDRGVVEAGAGWTHR